MTKWASTSVLETGALVAVEAGRGARAARWSAPRARHARERVVEGCVDDIADAQESKDLADEDAAESSGADDDEVGRGGALAKR